MRGTQGNAKMETEVGQRHIQPSVESRDIDRKRTNRDAPTSSNIKQFIQYSAADRSTSIA